MKRLLDLVSLVLIGLSALPAAAQDPNACDVAGEAPDVIVGDLDGIERHGTSLGITAYSFGTWSCNVGTCWLNWFSETSEHPVIGQNMFRLKNGRFEQIGQSWLKHGFFALSEQLCSTGCLDTDGTHLGVNCSDPYSSGLNGYQPGLGPKSEVIASRGLFPYPFSTEGQAGNVVYKRLQVHNEDLAPNQNSGALYFVEGQYVTADDAAAHNNNNNASYRQITISETAFGVYTPTLIGTTQRTIPAIHAWQVNDPGVTETAVDVPVDGRFIVAARATDLGGGVWHYEYAVHNLNSHRSAQSFTVPLPPGVVVSNAGFHDVDYHSGEPYDGTDWTVTIGSSSISWSTDTFAVNPNANALRWGTLYNFRFDADVPPANDVAVLGLFRTGSPASVNVATVTPQLCDGDGICEAGENCNNCPGDCVHSAPNAGVCGNGICEPSVGEDCLSCGTDCRGVQGGTPANRFCCGDGAGQNPVGCADARCSQSGFTCSNVVSICCGDGSCQGAENRCNCRQDCGQPSALEVSCSNAQDDDCDGATDCVDTECCFAAGCTTPDVDGDGFGGCDCNDANAQVWGTPGEARNLMLGDETTLSWTAPADLGGLAVQYDVLRSAAASNFTTGAVCVAADVPAPTAQDAAFPPAGGEFCYLVRATNACPAAAGNGPLGTKSDNTPRPGRICP
ncbi:MAG TPA: hypothetical protein VJS92_18350 [Candidatus Polarisedimenticolaceae bacterium]|nr:hypothetical protein [Candidatus Polarisedimenticolaceae bacterium]